MCNIYKMCLHCDCRMFFRKQAPLVCILFQAGRYLYLGSASTFSGSLTLIRYPLITTLSIQYLLIIKTLLFMYYIGIEDHT